MRNSCELALNRSAWRGMVGAYVKDINEETEKEDDKKDDI